MRLADVVPAWGKILRGYKPLLSLEITRECPLRCPGCYAYEPGHLGARGPLRQLNDYKGEAFVSRVLPLVRRFSPIHISIVGRVPVVRSLQLSVLLPKLDAVGVQVPFL